MKLKIEKTISYQIEGPGEAYCATTYNRQDAELVRKLAEGITNLRCLKEHGSKRQPKGLYAYRGKYPLVESYDSRLHRRVLANIKKIKGD